MSCTVPIDPTTTFVKLATALQCDLKELTDLNQVRGLRLDERLELDFVRLPPTLSSTPHGFGSVTTADDIGLRLLTTRLQVTGGGTSLLPRPRSLNQPPLDRIRKAVAEEARRVSQAAQGDVASALDQLSPLPVHEALGTIYHDAHDPTFASLTSRRALFEHAGAFIEFPPRFPDEDERRPEPTSSSSASSNVLLSITCYDGTTGSRVKECWDVPASLTLLQFSRTISCGMTSLPHGSVAPNSMLFVHDRFYVNDSIVADRYCDLSEPLRNWEPSEGVRPYSNCTVSPMSAILLGQIPFRLGESNVFRHAGHCDHIFSIDDVRRGGVTDPFPRRRFAAPERLLTCDVCQTVPARTASYGNVLCPFHPTVFCRGCFQIIDAASMPALGTAETGPGPRPVTFELPDGIRA